MSVKPSSVWVHRAFLLICGLPSLYIASVIPLNKFTDWEFRRSIHLSPKVNSFVVDLQGGLANACLSFAASMHFIGNAVPASSVSKDDVAVPTRFCV
jgi:hypothetical protein